MCWSITIPRLLTKIILICAIQLLAIDTGYAQYIMVEAGKFTINSTHRSLHLGISMLFPVTRKFSVGMKVSSSNFEDRTDNIFFHPSFPLDLDPTHLSYRYQDAKVLIDDERFYRGTHSAGQLGYTSFNNIWQSYGASLALHYDLLIKEKYNIYFRLLPGYYRQRLEYIQTRMPFSDAYLHPDADFIEVLYAEKLVFYESNFEIASSFGFNYRLFSNLMLGLDFGFDYSSYQRFFRQAFTFTYIL